MAKTVMMGGSTSTNTTTANTTSYIYPVGNNVDTTTEANAQLIIKTNGTLQDLGVRISTNSIAGTTVFTFRKNSTAGNQTLSVAASTTGWFEDNTNTDSVVVGDLICVKYVPGAATNTMVIYQTKMEFDTTTSTTNTITRMGATQAEGNTGHTTASTAYYYPINAAIPITTTVNTTEANVQWKEQYSMTYKNLGVKVSANSRATATTARFRKNTANGNQVVTVTATTTGWFEDNTNTDSVVANDLVDYSFTTGTGTLALTLNAIVVDCQTTSNPGIGHLGAGYSTNPSIAKALTTNIPITGRFGGSLTTEAFSQVTLHDTYTFKGLTISITTNTVSAASTVKLRVNSANSIMSISIASNTTGVFEDLTNTVTIANGNIVNYQLVTGATGTAMTIKYINSWTQIAGVSSLQNLTRTLGESITLTQTSTNKLEEKLRTTSETLTVTDTSTNRLRLKTTLMTDSITIEDTEQRLRGRTTSGADSLTLTHATTNKIENKIKQLAEALTFTHTSTNRLRTLTRTRADSMVLTDTRTRLRGRMTGFSNSITITDSMSRIRPVVLRALTGSLTLISDTLRLRNLTRSRTDSLTMSHPTTFGKLTTRLRVMTDQSLTLSESIARTSGTTLKNLTRTISQSLTFTSNTDRQRVLTKTRTDSVSLTSPTTQRLRFRLSTFSNALTLGSNTDRLRHRPVLTTSSLTFTNATNSLRSKLKSISHIITFSDTGLRLRGLVRTGPSQSLGFSESVARLTTRLRGYTNSITITESIQNFKTKVRGYGNSISLTESVSRAMAVRIRFVAHSLTFNNVTSKGGNILRVFDDSLTLTHTILRQRFKLKGISHSLNTASDQTRQTGRLRVLADSLDIVDSPSRLRGLTQLISHELTMTEYTSRLLLRLTSILHSLNLVSNMMTSSERLRNIQDNINFITSDLNRSVGRLRYTNTSNLTFTDSVAKLKGGFSRFVSQALTLSSTATRQTNRLRQMVESLNLTQATVNRYINMIRGLPIHSLTLTEITTKLKAGKTQVIVETLSFVESIEMKVDQHIRGFTESIVFASTSVRLTDRIKMLTGQSLTFVSLTAFIKAGVGTTVLPTVVFAKILTNKIIKKM